MMIDLLTSLTNITLNWLFMFVLIASRILLFAVGIGAFMSLVVSTKALHCIIVTSQLEKSFNFFFFLLLTVKTQP